MITMTDANLNNNTIRELGLRLSDKKVNAVISPDARVFEYPHLENVFIMENDLYGNVMPKDSCFLAFTGHHGLIGMHLSVEALLKATVEDMKTMVESNIEG